MTTQQPEALRLAEKLRSNADALTQLKAADAIDRLHAESEQHLQELRSYRITVENREARIVELEARVHELEASQARVRAIAVSALLTASRDRQDWIDDMARIESITQEKQG